MPSPAGGTKTNRPKIIAAVVRNPSFELPGPEDNPTASVISNPLRLHKSTDASSKDINKDMIYCESII